MSEEWRPVVGFEGLYEVSDQGQVRSLPRATTSGRVLRVQVNSGYARVSLSKEGHQRPHKIHKLVLAAFVGPCPEGLEIRHLNGDPEDARLTNLRYGTKSENARDRVVHGTHNYASRPNCPKCGGPWKTRKRGNSVGRYCPPCNKGHHSPSS